jgi:hypothetical protein
MIDALTADRLAPVRPAATALAICGWVMCSALLMLGSFGLLFLAGNVWPLNVDPITPDTWADINISVVMLVLLASIPLTCRWVRERECRNPFRAAEQATLEQTHLGAIYTGVHDFACRAAWTSLGVLTMAGLSALTSLAR